MISFTLKHRSSIAQALMDRAQRIAVQPPRARCTKSRSKSDDLGREAVGWNGGLGGFGL
jgi:hypothetical protein